MIGGEILSRHSIVNQFKAYANSCGYEADCEGFPTNGNVFQIYIVSKDKKYFTDVYLPKSIIKKNRLDYFCKILSGAERQFIIFE